MTDDDGRVNAGSLVGLTHAGVTGKVPLKLKPGRRKAGKPVKLSTDGRAKLKHLQKSGHISPKGASIAGIGGSKGK